MQFNWISSVSRLRTVFLSIPCSVFSVSAVGPIYLYILMTYCGSLPNLLSLYEFKLDQAARLIFALSLVPRSPFYEGNGTRNGGTDQETQTSRQTGIHNPEGCDRFIPVCQIMYEPHLSPTNCRRTQYKV